MGLSGSSSMHLVMKDLYIVVRCFIFFRKECYLDLSPLVPLGSNPTDINNRLHGLFHTLNRHELVTTMKV